MPHDTRESDANRSVCRVIKADSLRKDNGCHSDTNAIGLMPGPYSLHVLEQASFCQVTLCVSVLECASSESGTMSLCRLCVDTELQ